MASGPGPETGGIPATPRKLTEVSSGDAVVLREVLRDLWNYRLLLWVFCKRDLRARYTQTILGAGWVILTPLTTVGVFTIVFGLMVKVPTDGLPTILFYLMAVVPWFAFINVVNPTVQMVEGNVSLITKVFFPRLLIPGSYALGATVDFAVAFALLIVPFAWGYGMLTAQLLLVTPVLLLLQLMIATGVGLTLAPLNARYRDVKHMVPLGLQLFYYSTPAIYPRSAVPSWAAPWYEVNPLSLIITAWREACLGRWPDGRDMAVLALEAVVIFLFGCWYYLRFDRKVVDVI